MIEGPELVWAVVLPLNLTNFVTEDYLCPIKFRHTVRADFVVKHWFCTFQCRYKNE